jgi:hypothetical protein
MVFSLLKVANLSHNYVRKIPHHSNKCCLDKICTALYTILLSPWVKKSRALTPLPLQAFIVGHLCTKEPLPLHILPAKFNAQSSVSQTVVHAGPPGSLQVISEQKA